MLERIEGSQHPGRLHEGGLMMYWSGAGLDVKGAALMTEASGEDLWLAPTV